MLHGYHGCYRRVDVTTGTSVDVPLAETVLRNFIGGSGLGTYLLLAEQGATVDPLSPEAYIAFVFSPLVSSPLTTSAKFAVVSKSPLTGRINDALAGSRFAIAGKRTGCDAIVLTGRAHVPSILVIDSDRVELQPAGDLWGSEIASAEKSLRDRFGGEFQAAVIGPAGERQVLFATISHDGRHAGRGGSGAVLGAKNLKAIVVRGTQKTAWAAEEQLIEAAKRLSDLSFGPATAKYRELGTAENLLIFNRLHALPTRNFQQGSFADAAQLAPEQLAASRSRTRSSCAACTIGCEHMYGIRPRADAGSRREESSVRVEYENLFALGPLCGIGEADEVLRASARCDQLGIDTISAGGTIAFAMECAERGFLDEPWLQFGSPAALHRCIEMIATRTGLGDRMATGCRRMGEELGGDAIDFAPHVKGLEIPGYEPRALQTMALGFAVGTRGADHNRSGAYEIDFSDQVDRRALDPSGVELAIQTEDSAALMDSLILCKFLRGVFDDFPEEAAELLALVTGWDVTGDELRQTARRIVFAKKVFNIRAGWQPKEDTLPARLLDNPLADDPKAELSRERLAEVISAYNMARGWTSDGFIPEAALEQLDLSDL